MLRTWSWKTPTLLWKSWGEEVIVFNLASGNTHLLNPVAAQVLRALERKPANTFELSSQIAASANIDADEEFIQHVEQLVTNLDELGLVEPVS
jgi:PqqD family protein of HPr-rel-A system